MATGWKVTGQRQTTVSNGLTYVPAMLISFKTKDGNLGSIEVPSSEYTKAKVAALLHTAATEIDEIGALAGPES
jgi:hypothetical protein